MPNILMLDTTSHSDTGSLRKGEVYAVSDELAAHLIAVHLAKKTNAQTTAERNAELADEPEPDDDDGKLDETPKGTEPLMAPPAHSPLSNPPPHRGSAAR